MLPSPTRHGQCTEEKGAVPTVPATVPASPAPSPLRFPITGAWKKQHAGAAVERQAGLTQGGGSQETPVCSLWGLRPRGSLGTSKDALCAQRAPHATLWTVASGGKTPACWHKWLLVLTFRPCPVAGCEASSSLCAPEGPSCSACNKAHRRPSPLLTVTSRRREASSAAGPGQPGSWERLRNSLSPGVPRLGCQQQSHLGTGACFLLSRSSLEHTHSL